MKVFSQRNWNWCSSLIIHPTHHIESASCPPRAVQGASCCSARPAPGSAGGKTRAAAQACHLRWGAGCVSLRLSACLPLPLSHSGHTRKYKGPPTHSLALLTRCPHGLRLAVCSVHDDLPFQRARHRHNLDVAAPHHLRIVSRDLAAIVVILICSKCSCAFA